MSFTATRADALSGTPAAQSSVRISSMLKFCQGAMYKMDRDRTFANG
jgi:hypothetical protein